MAFNDGARFRAFSEYVARVATSELRGRMKNEPDASQKRSGDVLESVLDKAFIRPKSGELSEPADHARRTLLSDVVYLVLNHTPLTRPKERDFIAAINWVKVDDSTKHRLSPRLSRQGSPVASKDGARPPRVYSMPADHLTTQQKRAVQHLWLDKWDEYAEITRDGEKHDRYTTWNQFLLRHCHSPTTVGIVWGSVEGADTSYGQLDSGAATAIGLPEPTTANWIQQLLDLHPQSFRSPSTVPTSLQWLANRWDEMEPLDDDPVSKRAATAVSWTVFHLLRCYGIWGGRAFISIPFTFGTRGRDNTGVLSLCTTRPLEADKVACWELLSTRIFNPLVSEDAAYEKKKGGEVEAYWHVGHTLKVSADVTSWAARYAELAEAAQTCTVTELQQVLYRGAVACALMGFSHGVGSLIGLLGNLRKHERSKLEHWLDSEAFHRWECGDLTGYLEAYVAALSLPAKAVCLRYELPRLIIRSGYTDCAPAESEWSCSAGIDELRDLDKRSVPPFSAESQVMSILFAAALEPLKNAAVAMTKPHDLRGAAPLTIEVLAPRDKEQPLLFRVGNPTRREPSTGVGIGVRQTEDLFRVLRLVTFDEEVTTQPIGKTDNVRMWWVSARIYPWRLAYEIRQEITENRNET